MDSEVFIICLPAKTSFLVSDYRRERKQRLLSGCCHILLVQKLDMGTKLKYSSLC